MRHTDEEWRELLSPSAYAILRRAGTERAGSSPLAKVGCESPPASQECMEALLEKVLLQLLQPICSCSALLQEKRAGTFVCGGCGLPLFASEAKFESGGLLGSAQAIRGGTF